MRAQLVVYGAVDREVVGGEQVSETDCAALGVGEVVGLRGLFQLAHSPLGEPVVERALVPQRHAAAALVVKGDAQPDEFAQPRR